MAKSIKKSIKKKTNKLYKLKLKVTLESALALFLGIQNQTLTIETVLNNLA